MRQSDKKVGFEELGAIGRSATVDKIMAVFECGVAARGQSLKITIVARRAVSEALELVADDPASSGPHANGFDGEGSPESTFDSRPSRRRSRFDHGSVVEAIDELYRTQRSLNSNENARKRYKK
ncbi:hypothetical protein [uncultured Lamprocystis sp.]|uniref:hypothetical protein n=1 Tax=uncultured Lamprocystis sp. TaxID=543132 RepID=UPI0025D4BA80|nr:hypothetical protein [uncultured Lamprocystis sp.]